MRPLAARSLRSVTGAPGKAYCPPAPARGRRAGAAARRPFGGPAGRGEGGEDKDGGGARTHSASMESCIADRDLLMCSRNRSDDGEDRRARVQAERDKLCVVDRYPSDSIVFSSHGCDLHIDNELVAEAFSALPQTEQSVLILHCTLDLTDGEIGSLVGMSRSAVQRHRTRALQERREALSSLMPRGG